MFDYINLVLCLATDTVAVLNCQRCPEWARSFPDALNMDELDPKYFKITFTSLCH